MKTNTDPRAAGSRDAQGLWKYIRSFTKSVDELAEHEMTKGKNESSIDDDVWHKPYSTEHVHAGKPTGATGGEAVELAGRHRGESEQLGGSAAAEALSKLLERQDRMEKTIKALLVALGKSVNYDVDPEAFDDDKEENEEDEDGETSKGMPSTDIAGLMNAVAGRRDGGGIRVPPSFAKAAGPGLWQTIEQQIEQLPLGKSFAASELLGMAQMVREGRLDEDTFQTKLHGAPAEVKRIFDPLGRDHVVSRWAS